VQGITEQGKWKQWDLDWHTYWFLRCFNC